MPLAAPEDRLYVVVGVVRQAGDTYLLQQRRPGTPCAGQWEFPGGKLETGEDPLTALDRELDEELGIRVREAQPLVQVRHDYDHARVWLDVYRVTRYSGTVAAREQQAICWLRPDEILERDILPPVVPIVRALGAA